MNLISEHPFSRSGLLVRNYRLDNGLSVLLLRDPVAPVLAYQTWFRVGSRHERPGKTGIAHLFEHLMFKQTRNTERGQFDRLIETQGGYTNAATWVDWTFYQDDLPAAELELAVRLEADRMVHLMLTPEQVEPEREVVMNERMMRVDDDVDGFLNEEMFRLAFTTHPYHWPTIGWMEDIKAITLEDAVEFYRTYYAPNNATVVLVGDFEEARALDLIQRHYGDIRSQPLPTERTDPEPEQVGERRAVYQKPVATDRLLICYKGPSYLDSDYLHLSVLSDVLMGGPSSRLYRDLVVEREMASSIRGDVMPFRDPGVWEISASLQRGYRAEDAEPVIYQHLRAAAEQPLDEAAVERAKARFLTHFYTEMRTAHGKAELLGNFETTTGDYRRLFSQADAVRATQPEDLYRVARRYVRDTCRTVIIGTPAGPVPAEEAEAEAHELAHGGTHLPGGPVHRSLGRAGGGVR